MEAKALCNFPRNINKESVIKCNPLMEQLNKCYSTRKNRFAFAGLSLAMSL